MKHTIKNGYYKIPRGEGEGKTLHFSMNCWAELKKDTGKGVVEWTRGFHNNSDVIDQVLHIGDVVFASAKAFDLEEGNKIDYNLYKVRNWVQSFTEEDSMEFMEALAWSANPNVEDREGK